MKKFILLLGCGMMLFSPAMGDGSRKMNAYYSNSPSLYGLGRGVLTVTASPGNIVWFTYDVLGRPDSAWWVLATPVVGIGGIFYCVGDVFKGSMDILSFGLFGDDIYLKNGSRSWLYEWLSEPASIDKMMKETERKAIFGKGGK